MNKISSAKSIHICQIYIYIYIFIVGAHNVRVCVRGSTTSSWTMGYTSAGRKRRWPMTPEKRTITKDRYLIKSLLNIYTVYMGLERTLRCWTNRQKRNTHPVLNCNGGQHLRDGTSIVTQHACYVRLIINIARRTHFSPSFLLQFLGF